MAITVAAERMGMRVIGTATFMACAHTVIAGSAIISSAR